MSSPLPHDDGREDPAALAARYFDLWEQNISAHAVKASPAKPAERV